MRGSRGGTPASQLGGINFELSSVEREGSIRNPGSLRGRRIQRIATQWRRRAGAPLLPQQLSSAEETRTSRRKGGSGTWNKGERRARAVGRSEGGDGRMLAAGIYRAATAQYVACLGETRRECDTRGFQPST